ncbi:MAG: OB-fold nucleic acid binding domain-containing protein, partial [Candidatus Nanopelagicales bacterium]
MMRTHGAGTLRAGDAGIEVTLAGWVSRRRDHGGVAFVDIRDSSGVSQVVIREEHVARDLRPESCVQITGDVAIRPAGNENAEIPTGDIEVMATTVNVLSEAAPL